MAGVNLQIRLPAEILRLIKQFKPKSNSQFVREAIEEKITKEMNHQKEQNWIAALQKQKNTTQEEDDDWLKAEVWED